MISLKQIMSALDSLDINADHIAIATAELQMLQGELDDVSVKGRQKIDTLLGCMMAIDAIIGEDTNG